MFKKSRLLLELLYSFNLLNGIDSPKIFRRQVLQRGSWQSQRRGKVQGSEADLFPCDDWSRLEIYGNHPLSAGRTTSSGRWLCADRCRVPVAHVWQRPKRSGEAAAEKPPAGAMHHFPKWCIIAPYPRTRIGRIIRDF